MAYDDSGSTRPHLADGSILNRPASSRSDDRAFVTCVVLLWLTGIMLRVTILAVPPVITRIRVDLGLSGTEVAILSTLPVMLFAMAALFGSLLVSYLGSRKTLVGGLIVVAIGSALRGGISSAPALYAATIVMAVGVSLLQPTMPTLIRQWTPSRIGFGAAVYSNGMLVGEVIPVWLAQPVIMPLVNDDWRLQLAFWSLPVAAVALLAFLLAPQDADDMRPRHANRSAWWPNWKDPLIWRLGMIFGSINALYFGTNTFLPDHLKASNAADLVDGALFALNFGQLPASLIILPLSKRLERRLWPYLACAVLSMLSMAGLIFVIGPTTLAWAGLFGFAMGASFTLGLALPPLLCEPRDVGRVSAATFTISYTFGVSAALVSGAFWDLAGSPAWAFAPLGACTFMLIATALVLKRHRQLV
jgi:CP family cyanate transporter-like MFS transporter